MRIELWALAVAGTLCSGQAAAISTPDHDYPYAGIFYAHEFSDSSRDSSGGNGFSLTLGSPIHWRQNNALELTFSGVARERDVDGKDDYQNTLGLDLVHDFGMYGWGNQSASRWLPQFKPYVLVGLVAVQDDVRGDKDISPGLDLGAGLFVPLPWYGIAARAEWRVQGELNDQTVPGEDYLIDYRINLGVQVPLTPFFKERKAEAPAPKEECGLEVVSTETGRRDCGTDSDRDGVIDGIDQCPETPEGTPVDTRGCPAGKGASIDGDSDGVPDMVDTCPQTQAGVVVDVNGCAVAQTLTLHDVYFKPDTAELSIDSRQLLDDVVATLKGQPNMRVEIGGHTDNGGSAAYNLMLSQQRAEAVRQYLIARGIEPGRLTAQGYGEFKPRASNAKEKGREENRRVDFKMIVD